MNASDRQSNTPVDTSSDQVLTRSAESKPTDARWEILGFLRFFLAWVVATGHLKWFITSPAPFYTCFSEFGGKAAVLGFLVVSGFSIAASLDRGSKGFYRRRFLRVYPLYFVAIFITIPLEAFLGTVEAPHRTFKPSSPIDWVGNFFLLQCFVVKAITFNGVVWSLSVECFFYLLAPYLYQTKDRIIWLLIFFSGAVYLMSQIEHLPLLLHYIRKLAAMRYFWAWLIGFELFRCKKVSVCIALVLFGAALVVLNQGENPEPLAVVAFLGSCLLVKIAPLIKVPNQLRPFMTYLGDLSYPLYLYQLPCFIALFAFFGVTDPLLHLVSLIVLTIFVYHLIDCYLKVHFITPWVNRILSRTAQPPKPVP